MDKVEREKILYYRKPFIFNLSKRIHYPRYRKINKNYLNHRILFNYFLILKKKQFLKFAEKAKRINGFFIENYLIFLEGRLFMFIYRSNFVTNIFKLKSIIEKGVFLINNEKKFHPNVLLKVGDIVQVNFDYLTLIKQDFFFRLINFVTIKQKLYKYMFINFKFMFIFFLRAPRINDIKYPFNIDIYLGGSIYFL